VPEVAGIGKLLVVLGIALVVVGGLLTLLGKLSGGSVFGWIGKLPGDLLFKRDHVTLYFPLATSILISIALSVILYFVSIFLKR
jgi:Protein of unknown function (DUF2905)